MEITIVPPIDYFEDKEMVGRTPPPIIFQPVKISEGTQEYRLKRMRVKPTFLAKILLTKKKLKGWTETDRANGCLLLLSIKRKYWTQEFVFLEINLQSYNVIDGVESDEYIPVPKRFQLHPRQFYGVIESLPKIWYSKPHSRRYRVPPKSFIGVGYRDKGALRPIHLREASWVELSKHHRCTNPVYVNIFTFLRKDERRC